MFRSISMPEFYQETKNTALSILDVRETDEFASGHIHGARNMPLSGIVKTYQELDKGTEYYVLCQSGGRSSRIAKFLGEQGYNVVNVMGGMSAWMGEVV